MKLRYSIVSLLAVIPVLLNAQQDKPSENRNAEVKRLETVQFDISIPLRLMVPKPIMAPEKRGTAIVDKGPIPVNDGTASFKPDPVLQSSMGSNRIPDPSVSFNALSNLSGVSPPDPAGDVGPNHYVAMTNLSFRVLDKSGASLFGPAANNTLWSGFGGPCEAQNAGDPIVLHDQVSDRWLLTQFTSSGSEYFNCVALSTSPDPTGTYYRWAFSNGPRFPDYPKYGVWGDGFYISTRDFQGAGGAYVGVGAYAIDRDALVAGDPNPTVINFFIDRSTEPFRVGDGLLPADLDGNVLPPDGSPQYFFGTMDDGGPYGAPEDALNIWEFVADFDNVANSSFTLVDTIGMADYDTQYPCNGGRNCIPQLGTTNGVDIQSYRQRPLHRLAYRNFGTHESFVTNQSVEAAPALGGIRWWELRKSTGNPLALFQEGTFAPGVNDGIHRWMGSIAMDAEGNMGLAYSASSDTINPAIRYTGRLVGDTLGEMPQGEGSIIEGSGSQTSGQRWGDYTSLNVDPVDDCTFWHVNEYYEADGTNWQIRVGAFKFDECGDPGFFLSSPSPSVAVCNNTDASFDLEVGSISNFDAEVTLSVTDLPGASTGSFSVNPVPSLPGSSVLTVANLSGEVAGDYLLAVTGMAAGVEDKTINLDLNLFDAAPGMTVLDEPLDMASNLDVQPTFSWSGMNALSYTIEIATDAEFTDVVFSTSITGETIAPSAPLNSNTEYFWRVTAENPCGGDVVSEVFSFSTAPAPGDCSAGTTANDVYSYDFEAGLNGWTSAALVGPDTWAEDMSIANSGVSSWNGEDVAEVSDQVFVSPEITLPSNELPLTFQFFNNQVLEDGGAGCYDGGILEISTDGGANYTQIPNEMLLTDPYDGEMDSGFNNPLAGVDAWCGDPQQWLNSIVDISSFEGQTVQFRFRIATDSSVGRDGWNIDDVKVQSCSSNVDPDIIFADGFETP